MLRTTLLVAAVALVVAAPAPVALAGPGSGGGNPSETRVEGTVVAVAGSTVSIRTQGGAVVAVTAGAGTKVERNGRPAAVAQFKVGDRGQARLTGGVATKIEATGV